MKNEEPTGAADPQSADGSSGPMEEQQGHGAPAGAADPQRSSRPMKYRQEQWTYGPPTGAVDFEIYDTITSVKMLILREDSLLQGPQPQTLMPLGTPTHWMDATLQLRQPTVFITTCNLKTKIPG